MRKKTTTPLSVGEQLTKELASQNKTEFAHRIGISRSQLYNLLNDRRRLTFETAKSLGEVSGKGAKYWLQLEFDHRLHSKGLA